MTRGGTQPLVALRDGELVDEDSRSPRNSPPPGGTDLRAAPHTRHLTVSTAPTVLLRSHTSLSQSVFTLLSHNPLSQSALTADSATSLAVVDTPAQ